MNKNNKGVSVIICCYNSSLRIEETLNALAKQRCNADLLWEILIVDNASTDNTAEIASAIWENLCSLINMRIVNEHLPGLGNARKKGIAEALYSVLLFCDDDNWLAKNYVQGVFDLLQTDETIAACGGMGIPVFETFEPFWFYQYAESFALGSQQINNENGRILNLYGAGLAINKNAIEKLEKINFQPQMTGRTGNKLSSSEDTELTYAFVLMGYKLICSDELKFFHFLPAERLTFDYLKKLHIAFGHDGPVRNLYYSYITNRFLHRHIKSWSFHFILSVYRLLKYFFFPPKKYGRSIYLHWNIAYIKQLFLISKNYTSLKENICRIKGVANQTIQEKNSKESILPFETLGRV